MQPVQLGSYPRHFRWRSHRQPKIPNKTSNRRKQNMHPILIFTYKTSVPLDSITTLAGVIPDFISGNSGNGVGRGKGLAQEWRQPDSLSALLEMDVSVEHLSLQGRGKGILFYEQQHSNSTSLHKVHFKKTTSLTSAITVRRLINFNSRYINKCGTQGA